MRIALINPPLRSTVCERGVGGYQMPLGLLMVGGPLVDAGHEVRLIDAACGGLTSPNRLTESEVAVRVAQFDADVVMIGHIGSTQAHPCTLRTLQAVKAALPDTVTVYGGVHPTYHCKDILSSHPEVDLIVRGEGEATALDLVSTLAAWKQSTAQRGYPCDLSRVQGLVWRKEGQLVTNPSRAPVHDLDAYRIGWELVHDWDKYQAFGLGRSAVVQFSRGCPHACTYCGQWMFWKRWRHRVVVKFADELEWLHRKHDVRWFWLADENPSTDKETWKRVLEEIAARNLPVGLCGSFRAQDIVRDADLLHLYKQAGFLYVLIGAETVSDESLRRIGKGSCVDEAYQAVRLLRQHDIISIVDYIFGLEEETPRTLWRGLRGLLRYDGDFVNALYLTPHSWTRLGREVEHVPLIKKDLEKWDYRHQVLEVRGLSPTHLFLSVKLIELLYHLHPRRLIRLLSARDRRLRSQLLYAYHHTSAVFFYEILEAISGAIQRRQRSCRGVRAGSRQAHRAKSRMLEPAGT